MRLLLLSLLLLLNLPATAAENYLGISLLSRHFRPDHEKYNERNWGAFYEHRNETFGWQAGYYKNSFYESSYYGVLMWIPIRHPGYEVGFFVGGATGYVEGAAAPLIGALITIPIEGRLSLQFPTNPVVMGSQLKWRLGD